MAKILLSAFSDEVGDSLTAQLNMLTRNEIPYMELRSIEGINVADLTKEQAKEFNKRITDAGVKVWSLGSPIGKVDISVNFNEYLDKVKHVIETAKIFGTDKIRAFSFFNAYNERNKVIDYLSKMVELCKESGVKYCHENEKDIYGDTLERVLDLYKNVKGLKLVYDPANYVQVGEDTNKAIEKLYNITEYFHIKDVVAKTGELVPAGYGDGSIAKLISLIDKDVVLTLEPHLFEFGAYKIIDNTEMKHKFTFNSSDEAFDFATNSLKELILKAGYKKTANGFKKGE